MLEFNSTNDNDCGCDPGSLNGFTDPSCPAPSVVTWNSIQGKPSCFTPCAHTHVPGDIIGLEAYIESVEFISNIATTNSIQLTAPSGFLNANLRLSANTGVGYKVPLSILSDGLIGQIPYASGSNAGILSSGDWINFNNKFNTPTGTISQYVRGDGSLGTFPAFGTLSSVGITMPAAFGVVNSPLTSNGTIVVNALGTSAQYIRGDGTLAVFPTSSGSVTSVGLSMPAAFTVTNSPVISSGILTVAAAGTASQYIRGDGTLATLPTGGGSGGNSIYYYLNGSVTASVAGYKQMDFDPVLGLGTDFPLLGNGLIAQFLTDVANPNRLEIPGGAWNIEMWFSMSSSGGATKFYVELLKYNGTTFTTIADSSAVPETITGGTSIDLYLTSLAVPTTTLLATDRLAIRVYIVDNSGGRTATLHTENSHLCQIITTFSGGISALNGLTDNTQYFALGSTGTSYSIVSSGNTHTFNTPSFTIGSVPFGNGTGLTENNTKFFWDNTLFKLKLTDSKLQFIDTDAIAGSALLEYKLQNTIMPMLVCEQTDTDGDAAMYFKLKAFNNAGTAESGQSLGYLFGIIDGVDTSIGQVGLSWNTPRASTGANRLTLSNTYDSTGTIVIQATAYTQVDGLAITKAATNTFTTGTVFFSITYPFNVMRFNYGGTSGTHSIKLPYNFDLPIPDGYIAIIKAINAKGTAPDVVMVVEPMGGDTLEPFTFTADYQSVTYRYNLSSTRWDIIAKV